MLCVVFQIVVKQYYELFVHNSVVMFHKVDYKNKLNHCI